MKVLSFDHCDMTKEDMRWFIVGAHEAGAAETDIMAMTNLSKHTVRYAIDTYKRTGQPFYERQRQQHKFKKQKIIAKRPSDTSFFDDRSVSRENGMNDTVVMDLKVESPPSTPTDDTQANDNTHKEASASPDAWCEPPSLYSRVSPVQSIIESVLQQSQRLQSTNNASKIALGAHEPAPQHRPHPSPQQPSCSTSSTLHDEGLPLFDDLRQLTLSVHAAANAASDASPPMSPESALNSTFGAATLTSEATAAASMSSASRLHHWTVDDDRLLLKHTLYSLGQWQDFAALTDHRHTPDECRARWQLLKQLLFIELDKWTDY